MIAFGSFVSFSINFNAHLS